MRQGEPSHLLTKADGDISTVTEACPQLSPPSGYCVTRNGTLLVSVPIGVVTVTVKASPSKWQEIYFYSRLPKSI